MEQLGHFFALLYGAEVVGSERGVTGRGQKVSSYGPTTQHTVTVIKRAWVQK